METDVELQEAATGFQDYFPPPPLTVTPPLPFLSSLEKLLFPFSRHKSGVSLGLPCPTSSRYPERSPYVVSKALPGEDASGRKVNSIFLPLLATH